MPETDSTTEIWKPVVGSENWYAISSFGTVKRLQYGGGSYPGKILKPGISKKKRGYLFVNLWCGGKKSKGKIHIMVARAFLGPCPPGKETNHKDGVKTNCRLDNLEYTTPKENVQHAHRLGLVKHNGNPGEKHPLHKLSENQVINIRSLVVSSTHEAIAKQFGVCRATISLIAGRKTWKHI